MVTSAYAKQIVGGVVTPELRCKHTTRPTKISEERKDEVKRHIESFASIESHYCRKDTNKQYLSPNLSVAKMHSLYLEKHANSAHSPVSESYSRLVFNTEYNLAFHRPMRDQCDLCKSFQNSNNDEKAKLQEEYDRHISNKLLSRASKDSDKLKAKAADTDFVAACFDLEEVLLTPHSFESVLYYKRRLNTFNFTLYNMGTKDGYCYVWNKTMACRGASEIASCVLHFIKTMSESGKNLLYFTQTTVVVKIRTGFMQPCSGMPLINSISPP